MHPVTTSGEEDVCRGRDIYNWVDYRTPHASNDPCLFFLALYTGIMPFCVQRIYIQVLINSEEQSNNKYKDGRLRDCAHGTTSYGFFLSFFFFLIISFRVFFCFPDANGDQFRCVHFVTVGMCNALLHFSHHLVDLSAQVTGVSVQFAQNMPPQARQ